jgi:hypothetical protein
MELKSLIESRPPGSLAALSDGCKCPVLDNAHGAGLMGGLTDEYGKTMYVVNYECPLHGVEEAAGEGVIAHG